MKRDEKYGGWGGETKNFFQQFNYFYYLANNFLSQQKYKIIV